jgi:hypothetical protein
MSDVKFRSAAGAYLLYGIVYWIGGVYLVLQGVGVRGEMGRIGVAWIVVGTVLVLAIPYLLSRPRPWFDRWVLSRRDFARVLAFFMAIRAFKVGQVAIRPETATVPLPWTGAVTFRLGAAVFLAVTIGALLFVARAAWAREEGEG